MKDDVIIDAIFKGARLKMLIESLRVGFIFTEECFRFCIATEVIRTQLPVRCLHGT